MEIEFKQVTWEEVAAGGGADIDMDKWRIGTEKMYTSGLNPCYAVGMYGTTPEGVKQMLLCHASATLGDGDGENVVKMLIKEFGVTEESLVIVVVSGAKSSRQYLEAKELATYSLEPQPIPKPEGEWNVEVALLPDGTVQWAPLIW